MNTRRLLSSLGLAVVLLVGTGCATNKSIQIQSSPSGADVFVDGRLMGKTPLVLTTSDIMPGRAFDAKPSTQAMLVIEAPGYSSYQLLLKEFALPDHVNAELHPERATTAGTGSTDLVEELERLQALREQGALTEDEFERLKAKAIEEAEDPDQ